MAGTTTVVSYDIAIMSHQLDNVPLSTAIFRFIGVRNFTDTANWENNLMPPNHLPNGSENFINAAGAGQCLINTNYRVSPGGKFTVVAGKKLLINIDLIIFQ